MAEAMFAPLAGGAKGRSGGDSWAPVAPVPADAPPPPAAHPKRGRPALAHTYRGAGGELLGLVWRFDSAGGAKEFLPVTFCRDGEGRTAWRFKGFAEPRPLYGLAALAARPDAPVVVAEGEKAADAAALLLPDHVAVTSPNGSHGAGKADWAPLAGRRVVIWPDADEPGARYAAAVARALAPLAEAVAAILPPPAVKPGWDAADALAEGWDADRTAALVAQAQPMRGAHGAAGRTKQDGTPLGKDSAEGGGRRRGPAQKDSLVALADDAEIWRTPDGEVFASLPVNGHVEHWPVRGRTFRNWLAATYYREQQSAPGGQAVEDALRVMEARALHEGAEHPIFIRLGSEPGAVWLDLGDAAWRAVRITADGWQVVDHPAVKFQRTTAMRPLPAPEAGYDVDELRNLVNVTSEGDFKLLVAWLVGALHPTGPYPILAINGEQGSSKSTLSRLLRLLIDPNAAPIRSAPRDDRELVIMARNSWALVMDNLSGIPGWLSDALCRLATGGGFSTRELFTDWGETIFYGRRPIILNGIPDLASRADLADRCIALTLPAIPEDRRRTEAAFWQDFERTAPLILGALLDGVAAALRHRHAVHLPNPPRMADFAEWITAAEPGLGWHAGDFLDSYDANRQGAVEAHLEADPVSQAVRDLADETGCWEGTPTALMAELEKRTSEAVRKLNTWPAVNGLRSRLRRCQAPLRALGIMLDLEKRASTKDRARLIGIRKE